MGADAAHRVEADRATDHLVMLHAPEIGPGLIDDDLFFERCVRQFGGEAFDRLDRDTATLRHSLRRVFIGGVFRGKQLKHRLAGHAVHGEIALHRRFHVGRVERDG